MKVLRYVYAVLLCLIIAVLIESDVFSRKWMMYVFIVAGVILGMVIEDLLKRKYPKTFPPSEADKRAEKLIKEIEEEKVEETVKLPRTVFSTLCEILTVGIIGYAIYRAWVLDQRLTPVITLSVITLWLLFSSYFTDIKKEADDPRDLSSKMALVNSRHVTALFAALATLLLTYFFDQETYFRWRPLYMICVLLFAARAYIQHFLSKRSAAMMARINKYNPADIRVVHTVEGTAFEIVTVLLLIGAWCAAAFKHQLAGRGILDIPVADLIMCSALAISMLVLAYFPKWMSGANTFRNNDHVLSSIRRHRIIAVILALFALIIPFIPDVTEKKLGYLYIIVFALVTFFQFKKTDEQGITTENE